MTPELTPVPVPSKQDRAQMKDEELEEAIRKRLPSSGQSIPGKRGPAGEVLLLGDLLEELAGRADGKARLERIREEGGLSEEWVRVRRWVSATLARDEEIRGLGNVNFTQLRTLAMVCDKDGREKAVHQASEGEPSVRKLLLYVERKCAHCQSKIVTPEEMVSISIGTRSEGVFCGRDGAGTFLTGPVGAPEPGNQR